MATGLENLKIYQIAKRLELEVHKETSRFPKEEMYRSIDQLKRSSASVTNNIAECHYKRSTKERSYMLRNLVIGEGEETRSNILRCAEKGFIESELAEGIAMGMSNLEKWSTDT